LYSNQSTLILLEEVLDDIAFTYSENAIGARSTCIASGPGQCLRPGFEAITCKDIK